ncbi:hypothetical protein ACA086_04515 [Muriicola sp. E247]|uniref:hypothetical protein n=1 Tax=Muriicola sp. E247 TaxID=3242730 RepID=UPI00352360D3
MLKTIDRLIQFINQAGLSARQFDLSIGASNGYTLRMKKNRASIGSDVIENILRIYPQLNVVWLLTGEGTMLKEKLEPLPLDFDQLPSDKQEEIETIIENKIKERQQDELQRLMQEIRSELKKT